MFRGHYALPNLESPSGLPTGAIKGMMEMIFADMRALDPDYAAIVFDLKGKNFRHELYPEYKGGRRTDPKVAEAAEKVWSQKKVLRQILRSLGFQIVQKLNIEGDDVMGALAYQMAPHMPVYVGTNDKDIYQSIQKNVSIWTKDRVAHGPKECFAKFGVAPSKIIDYLTLIGDKVDNIPGVDKCGPKTAAKWLNEHGSLEAFLKSKPQLTPALAKNLKRAKKFFPISQQLFALDCQCIGRVSPERLKIREPNLEEFQAICAAHGLKALYRSGNDFVRSRGKSSTQRAGYSELRARSLFTEL